MDWTAKKNSQKPGEGWPMLKWTSYAKNEKNNRRKKTHCFDFILCSHNEVRIRRAPHLTCHVLCTSLWPNNLPLPPLLYSISIKASFTLAGRMVFCLFFVLLLKWIVGWFYFHAGSSYLSAVYGVEACVCALAWMYPGLSREDMRGCYNVCCCCFF